MFSGIYRDNTQSEQMRCDNLYGHLHKICYTNNSSSELYIGDAIKCRILKRMYRTTCNDMYKDRLTTHHQISVPKKE